MAYNFEEIDDDSRCIFVAEEFSGLGKSGAVVICGNCGERFKVYYWSLAGSGKRCPECKNLFMHHNLVKLVN